MLPRPLAQAQCVQPLLRGRDQRRLAAIAVRIERMLRCGVPVVGYSVQYASYSTLTLISGVCCRDP